MQPSQGHPEFADLDRAIERAQSQATALRNNIREGLSSIRRTQNSVEDTYTIRISNAERERHIVLIRKTKELLQRYNNLPLSQDERILLVDNELLIDTLALILQVELS